MSLFRNLSVLTCLLGASACVESALNPTDPVMLHGQALFEDQRPMAAAELSLARSDNSACVGVSPLAKATADGQGNFHFDMKGADTQSGEFARCFRLSTPASSKGATVSADFLVQVTEVLAPTLQQWNGAVTATAVADGTQVAFVDLAATHGVNDAKYYLEVKSGGVQLWSATDAHSPEHLSPWVLEDFAAPVATLRATTEVKGSGTTFTLRYLSDELAVPATALVPVSRGAPCTYNQAPTVCPLTDGKLANVAFDGVSEFSIELPQAKDVKKAVLRGLGFSGPASVVLEGSVDGATWTKLADVPQKASAELDLTNGSNTRHLRLRGTRSDSGTFLIQSLMEISIFE